MITHDLRVIADAILDKKGQNVVSLDLRPIGSAITDFFVVCNADSTTNVAAIADNILKETHEKLGLKLPKKAVFAFLSDNVDRYAAAHGATVACVFNSMTKDYPVYVLKTGGEEICLCAAPVGAPAAAQILDWLIAYGVREIISGGSCGVLVEMEENRFLIPARALRDEGTSYHYLPPSRFVEVNASARAAMEKAILSRGMRYEEVVTWSTDGFFRETKDKIAYRKSEGCSVVEMECAALAACAELRGAIWGELLYTADTLADAERYDERNWGGDSVACALELCIESVLNIGR